jgi:hypothetical protein
MHPTLARLIDGVEAVPDDRPFALVRDLVTEALARGATVADACAEAGIMPHAYLQRVETDEAAREAHDRALRVRRQLVLDEALHLSRELRESRRVASASGRAKLGEVARAVQVEAELAGRAVAPDEGAGARAGVPPVIRIVLEPMPSWAPIPDAVVTPTTDAASVAESGVSDAVPTDYTILEGDD